MPSTTKSRRPPTEPDKPAPQGGKGAPPGGVVAAPRPSATRETIEAIVVAFMLAFLFKTFEAEAFVIPTGSMAPTLLGRHKDVVCTQCGFHFTIGASDEVESESDYLVRDGRIRTAVCPNCRDRLPEDYVYNLPVFKGDRILVNKFPYEFADPQRWDVGVFKYPEEPKTNYIKRIVGLPGETLEIRQGDVYSVSKQGVSILRKADPDKQRLLQLVVYDNDHPETALLKTGWPERWAPVKKSDSPDALAGWTDDGDGWQAGDARSFRLSGKKAADSERHWLRYRNYVPGAAAWNDVQNGRKPIAPRPELITDFCGYNAYSNMRGLADDLGVYWVGDLTVDCHVDLRDVQPGGELLLELNEGARAYRCRIELASGRATLSFLEPHDAKDPGDEHVLATGTTDLTGSGAHDLSFANVDDRLCLWVDDRIVEFDAPTTYAPYGGLTIQRPWDEDLIPVGIAARGVDATVSRLLLRRDIYYRCDFVPHDHVDNLAFSQIEEYDGDKMNLIRKLSRPGEWFAEYERGLASRQTGPGDRYEHIPFQFTMGPDEFFMLGDNSPRSKDSRLWSNGRRAEHRHAVPRRALVGKAFFVYWPHGVPFGNGGRGWPDGYDSLWNNPLTAKLFYHRVRDANGVPVLPLKPEDYYPKFRVPFYPNVARMHRIR
jgi:signal peptidase I